MDNNYLDLDNKYLVTVFEKHLYPLVYKGFQSHTILPETYNQPLKLIYEGSFYLEVVRDFPCNTYINLSPRNLTGLRENKMVLGQLIYTLSEHKEYIGDFFQEIGCYYQNYEENVGKICDCFFAYFDEIQKSLRPENYPVIKTKLKVDEILYLKRTGFYPQDYGSPKDDLS
jgi:hypothetical protein